MFELKNTKVIGLCGVARSGKDTFCKFAIELLEEQKLKCKRVSFADELKSDLDPFLKKKVGISAFTEDPKEKTLIRDLLVSYGTKLMRKIDENYWINKISSKVDKNIKNDVITIITDIRYPNEMNWVQDKLSGKCIHVSRIKNKKPIGPANLEEAENDPKLKKSANSCLNWDSIEDEDSLKWIVGSELNNVFNLIE